MFICRRFSIQLNGFQVLEIEEPISEVEKVEWQREVMEEAYVKTAAVTTSPGSLFLPPLSLARGARLDFCPSLESGLRSSPRRGGSCPEQRLVSEPIGGEKKRYL